MVALRDEELTERLPVGTVVVRNKSLQDHAADVPCGTVGKIVDHTQYGHYVYLVEFVEHQAPGHIHFKACEVEATTRKEDILQWMLYVLRS